LQANDCRAAERTFLELADIKGTTFKNGARKGRKVAEKISPVALQAVKRFDAIFDIERDITGSDAETRRATRQKPVRPLVADLHDRLRPERARMSKHNPVARAINCMFEKEGRREAFTRFLDDGRIDKLEREKVVLSQLATTIVPPGGRLEESNEHALNFRSNPWNIWKN